MPCDTYNVYLGVYNGMPRDHHAIWVDTGTERDLPNGKSVDVGMLFQVKNGVDPEESNEGKEKIKIGTIRNNDLERLKQICSQLPPPSKQFNGP